MIKEEIDKNNESTSKFGDKSQATPKFIEGIKKLFEMILNFQAENNVEILKKIKMVADFAVEVAKSTQEYGNCIKIVFKAITELENKNKILEKEVNLLKEELDQLKNQGKQQ